MLRRGGEGTGEESTGKEGRCAGGKLGVEELRVVFLGERREGRARIMAKIRGYSTKEIFAWGGLTPGVVFLHERREVRTRPHTVCLPFYLPLSHPQSPSLHPTPGMHAVYWTGARHPSFHTTSLPFGSFHLNHRSLVRPSLSLNSTSPPQLPHSSTHASNTKVSKQPTSHYLSPPPHGPHPPPPHLKLDPPFGRPYALHPGRKHDAHPAPPRARRPLHPLGARASFAT